MSIQVHHGRGEVRRVHIIYFISRKGQIDHPHLLRVHHYSGNGVRLRDIKRWLSIVRGKDMPHAYAWSYKRRYKAGYVWQDSLDEDLITPISDNEYVIKGSEICSAASDYDDSSLAITDHEDSSSVEANRCRYRNLSSKDIIRQKSEATGTDARNKLKDIHEAPTNTEDSATLINDSTKLEETKHLISRSEEKNTRTKRSDTPFRLSFSKKKKNTNSKNFYVKKSTEMPNSSTSKLICSSKKIYSNNASNLFRKFITCGMVDTKDSAVKGQCKASHADVTTYDKY